MLCWYPPAGRPGIDGWVVGTWGTSKRALLAAPGPDGRTLPWGPARPHDAGGGSRVVPCRAVPAALVRHRQRAAARRAALREGQVRPIQCDRPARLSFRWPPVARARAAGRRRAWRCRLLGGDGPRTPNGERAAPPFTAGRRQPLVSCRARFAGIYIFFEGKFAGISCSGFKKGRRWNAR